MGGAIVKVIEIMEEKSLPFDQLMNKAALRSREAKRKELELKRVGIDVKNKTIKEIFEIYSIYEATCRFNGC